MGILGSTDTDYILSESTDTDHQSDIDLAHVKQ